MNWASARRRRRYAKHESSESGNWQLRGPAGDVSDECAAASLHWLDFHLICISELRALLIRN